MEATRRVETVMSICSPIIINSLFVLDWDLHKVVS